MIAAIFWISENYPSIIAMRPAALFLVRFRVENSVFDMFLKRSVSSLVEEMSTMLAVKSNDAAI